MANDISTIKSRANVIAKIAAGTFTGWTAVASGAVVTFTATTATVRAGAYTFADTGETGATAVFARVTAGVAAGVAAVGEQLVESAALTEVANTGKGLTIVGAGSLFLSNAKVGVGISSAAVVKLSIGLRKIF